MASIKDAERLIAEVFISNLSSREGLSITPLLSGPHGIGKTMIVKSAARRMGGVAIVADGSVIKEGEICGLPIARKTEEGTTEVNFVPHYTVASIQRLEKSYYEKAKKDGFMNGKYKLTEKGLEIKEGKETKIIPDISEAERVLVGGLNQYKFGGNLTGEQKLELIESGEIIPIILFIDELNRSENQTMKELMNIILNKNVNGYEFPWFVGIVSAINPCSQNSVYATNEMDPAQQDRFLKIKVDARFDEWVDYAIDMKLNKDVVDAIATKEDIFLRKDDSYKDTDQNDPSPRSWEMCCHLFDTIETVKKSKFFSSEEKSDAAISRDLSTLISGKVGSNAAAILFQSLKDKDSLIKPEEIFTAKSKELDKKIETQLKNLRQIRKKFIIDSSLPYIANKILDYEQKNKAGTEAGKKEYFNFTSQIKEFIGCLDESSKILFIKRMVGRQGEKVVCPNGLALYPKIAKFFSSDLLNVMSEFEADSREV